MAFDKTSETVSLRLNRIPVGTSVNLYSFTKKNTILASDAVFLGWKNESGESIEAPKVMKNMENGVSMEFEVIEDGNKKIITLVKDPDKWGAMFLKTEVEIKEGDETTTKTRFERVTAYAAKDLVDSLRTKKTEEAVSETSVEEVA